MAGPSGAAAAHRHAPSGQPLAGRLGPPPGPSQRRPPPPSPFFRQSYDGHGHRKPFGLALGPTMEGGQYYAPDLRSRLLHNLPATHPHLAREATAQGPRNSALAAADNNLSLSGRVSGAACKRGFLTEHRNLPLAESDASVRNRECPPLDKNRLDQIHFDYLGRFNNRFASRPQFESRCSFCGSRHCSLYASGSYAPNCRRYIQQITLSPTRRICNYRRCSDPTNHHTHVCPTLHQRCPRCQCRGHGPGDACDITNPDIMDRLRADFEAVADEGAYTRERRTLMCWGWYPYGRGAPLDFCPISYDDLTEMDVLNALTLLRNLLMQQENVAHFPPADDTVSSTRRDDDGPPPPPPGAPGVAASA